MARLKVISKEREKNWWLQIDFECVRDNGVSTAKAPPSVRKSVTVTYRM